MGGVPGPEVGPVAAEDLDPLAASVFDGLRGEVGDVVVTTAGHPDVRRGGAGRLAEREVGNVDGLALGSVRSGGERELDVLADVRGGQRTLAGTAGDEHAAVLADPGHGPRVTVGDCQVAVVASGGDPVAEADALTTARDGLATVLTSALTSMLAEGHAGAMAAVADGCVERTDLVAGVGDDQLVALNSTVVSTVGADGGEGCGAFDLAGMQDDLATIEEGVEDLTGPLTSAHEQAEAGLRGIAEPVDRVELVVSGG